MDRCPTTSPTRDATEQAQIDDSLAEERIFASLVRRASVMRMLLGQVAATIVAGLATGLPATWALTRVIESQLYGIRAHDPLSLLIASVGVASLALAAAFLPAHRALRIDPVRALRYE